MSRFFIYPYAFYSHSARDLAEILDGRIIKLQNSRFKENAVRPIINWGASSCPYKVMFNQPEAVMLATLKVNTYQRLNENNIPTCKFTRDIEEANRWNENYHVLGRKFWRGTGGDGVVVFRKGVHIYPLEGIKFYTRYFKKSREFRVHVFAGNVIHIQEKLKKNGDNDDYNPYVRSHDRGWVFGVGKLRDNPCPANVLEYSVAACKALGLDFGAVDVGWNRDSNVCVFEVNTAPGLEGSTVHKYADEFRKWL